MHFPSCLKNSFAVIALLFVLFSSAKAQDYSLLNTSNPTFFKSELSSGQLYLNSMNEYYSWSPIKETKIDSIAITGNSTIYYTFHTWRDTSFNDCGELYGPSWMGKEIIENITGTSNLFNENGDTITVERNAIPGQSWSFYHYLNSAEIQATVNSISWMNFSSFSDSVKEIQLFAYDSLAQPDTNHPANNYILLLSKTHGWIRYFSPREFPARVLSLVQIETIATPEYRDIYDFTIGDEFEYRGYCAYINGYNEPPGFSYLRIDDKWLNTNQDTVHYKCFVINLDLAFNSFPTPHLDSTVTIGIDTISYPYSHSPFYTTVAEENNTILHNQMMNSKNCYTMDRDSAVYNNRMVYTETDGYFTLQNGDSCMIFNHFEPLEYRWNYSPGLGLTYTRYNAFSQAGTDCITELFWYHKGSETWGTYQQLTSGTHEIADNPSFNLYPNPALNSLNLFFQNQLPEKVSVYTSEGRCVKTLSVFSQKMQIDISDLADGIYTLSVSGNNFNSRKTFIHLSGK